MSYAKKSILFVTFIFLIAGGPVWPQGDKNDNTIYPPSEPTHGLVMPVGLERFQTMAESEVDMKKAYQFFDKDIDGINYNVDGTINAVFYKDKTKVDYSYDYDYVDSKKGKLSAVTLESKDVKIIFSEKDDYIIVRVYLNEDGNSWSDSNPEPEPPSSPIIPEPPPKSDQDSHSYTDVTHLKGYNPYYPRRGRPNTPSGSRSNNGNFVKDRPVVIYYRRGELNLEDVATKPIKFDFKEIGNAMKKAEGIKEEAYKEYMKNTGPYYDKMASELKAKFSLLKSEGIDLGIYLERLKEVRVNSKETRMIVDGAVGYIRSENEKIAKLSLDEFLDFEERCGIEFLAPNKLIYDEKVKRAMEYIDGMIDKLLTSDLALYLKIKKDKIDVIINLPEDKKEE